MDDLSRLKKDEDRFFRELEEKERLQAQAKNGELRADLERRAKLLRKRNRVRQMLDSEGKSLAEAEAFIVQAAIESLAETLMGIRASSGRPITKEAAMIRAQELLDTAAPASKPYLGDPDNG